ncbi:MAG: CBS domain-containing protein [Desulfatiglandales bacterium]
MEKMKVRELMTPIEEFSRISSEATFLDAIEALEKADQEFKMGKAPERILLVYDTTGRIVGKLSPIDVVQGLEPNYMNIDNVRSGPYHRLSQASVELMKSQVRLWHKPLGELCKKAYSIKIRDFIKMPTPDQMVKADDKMDEALHLFVVARHGSLFVQEGKEIVGLLRFSDVYKKIKEEIRACPLPDEIQ